MGSWVRTQVTRLDDRYLYSGHLNGPKVSLLQNGTKIPLLQLNDDSLITSDLKSVWFPDHLDHYSLRSCFESGSKRDPHIKLLSAWGWKMAQSVTCLLCEHEDLSVAPQHTRMHTGQSHCCLPELGKQRQIPGMSGLRAKMNGRRVVVLGSNRLKWSVKDLGFGREIWTEERY